MILYSLAGAIFSACIMGIMKAKNWLHVPVVSAMGGVTHNLGQLLIAMITVETYRVAYYVPVLLLSGLLTGSVIGITAALVLPYLQKLLKTEGRI